MVVTTVILANSIFIFFDTNREIREAATGEPTNEVVYIAMEIFFLGFYSIELVLKFGASRLAFLFGDDWNWNIFDLVLVLLGLLTLSVSSSNLQGSTFLRLIRLVKIVKILRSFRLMKQVESLRILLHCLIGTVWELLWSIIMLVIVFFMFATVIVQLVAVFISSNPDADSDKVADILDSFGSEEQAMLSLFMACTGGDWTKYYAALSYTGHLTGALVLFFVCFTQIAFLNIVTGLFIETALDQAKPDITGRAAQLRAEKRELVELLQQLASEININGGNITADEFVETLEEQTTMRYILEVLGLDLTNLPAFFELLLRIQGCKRGTISIDDFISGCLKLRGSASSREMHALNLKVDILFKEQERQHRTISTMATNASRNHDDEFTIMRTRMCL
jgi:voltage-gated sodium channel